MLSMHFVAICLANRLYLYIFTSFKTNILQKRWSSVEACHSLQNMLTITCMPK